MYPYPYPPEISSPNEPSPHANMRCFNKIFSAIASRNPGVVVGGILVAGSIHMLHKGRRWICKRRDLKNPHEKEEGEHLSDSCSRTDSRAGHVISDQEYQDLQHTGATADSIEQHPDTSKRFCLARAKTNEHSHPFCQLSLVLTFLALCKVSSQEGHSCCRRCERHKSTHQEQGLPKPEMKLVSPGMEGGVLSFMETSGSREGQAQDQLAASGQNTYRKNAFRPSPLPETSRSALPELESKPVAISTPSGSEMLVSPSVEEKRSNHGSVGGQRHRTKTRRNQAPNQSKQQFEHSRSTHTQNNEGRTGTRRRRGGRRRNNAQRLEYVDLDNI